MTFLKLTSRYIESDKFVDGRGAEVPREQKLNSNSTPRNLNNSAWILKFVDKMAGFM